MRTRTVDRARGRWPEILAQLGVESRFLVNKHGACPVCGGRDRFRFDDKSGTGSFFCNQCGAGFGITLLMRVKGLTYAEACRQVDGVIGTDIAPPRRLPDRANDPDRRARALRQVLDEATAPEIVTGYLAARGISVAPPILQGHRRLLYIEDGRSPERQPAVVAPVVDVAGNLQSVHRIYFAAPQRPKKLMPPVDTVAGATVRLFDVTDTLGLAEGVETAIAAFELFGVPVWATVTAGGMEAVVVPPAVRRVVIFGDNDNSFAGQRTAYVLANRLVVKAGLDVEVHIPPDPDTDWLNVLNARRTAA